MNNGKWAEVEGFTDPFNDDERRLYARSGEDVARAMKMAPRAVPAAGRLSSTNRRALEEKRDGLRGDQQELYEASERAERQGRKAAKSRLAAVGLAVAQRLTVLDRLLSNAWSELHRTRRAVRAAINNARRFARRAAGSAPRAGRARRSARPVAKAAASGGGGGDDGSGLDPAPKAPAAFSSARRLTFASVLRSAGGAL
ncbi:MAG: hypothetical protein ABFD84_01055 [Candidatus Polarisedimenticolia bacterium]